jgi:CheY-like chemotaxis protein
MLQLAGYSTLTAADGVEALDLCTSSTHPIDLLLTDIKMPRMNGADLAYCLAEHRPGMPIMFMTGNASESEVKRILTSQPGLDGHAVIGKPFTMGKLVSAIERLMAKSEDDRQAAK